MDNMFGNKKNKSTEDYYQTLGCDSNSSSEQIICEYKNRALLLHPDKHDDKESEELFKQLVKAKESEQIICEYKNRALLLHPDKHDDKESEELFKQLVKAKEVLTDPQMRKQYDKWRSSGIAISFEEWNRLGKGAQTSMHWRNDYKRDLMIGNGDNESSDQRQHRSGSGSRVFATDWSSDCNDVLKKFRNYDI
ncbi:unnamed protein product [Oppiella nova]|uniref:J domain-containing protein n=1 Tax=Oppiella nova TaxID=334625 RepID=A0A7R9LEB8_9ACAR|nr:unnamed protein product [Oppiella nova]CAG2162822.1 unnamed protein product [Oppiella nova]